MEKKITKAERFAQIKELVAAYPELVEFVDAEIASLQKKAEKAKERAASKKAQNDELGEVVLSLMTAELQTVNQLVAAIDGEDVTPAKVVSRCKKLVDAGVIVKESVKVESSKRPLVAYRLA